MQRVIVSLSLVLLFSLAVVPVSAWATSEPVVSSSVPASSVGADAGSVVDAGSISQPDQTADPAASSTAAAASEPAAGSDDQGGTVYNVTIETEEAEPTIWDKDFNEYTPTEGYLFLLFVLLLSSMVFKLFKGGIW